MLKEDSKMKNILSVAVNNQKVEIKVEEQITSQRISTTVK